MAILASFTAPWSLRAVLERGWRLWPAMIFATGCAVDDSDWLYRRSRRPTLLELMPAADLPASLALYRLCGAAWCCRGSLRGMVPEIGGERLREAIGRGANR